MAVLDNLSNLIQAGQGTSSAASFLAKIGTPTASVAVLEDGVVSSRCFSTVGDDTETVFQACSISKPVTAVAVMRLIDEGRLRLDSTIAELLPQDVLDILTEDAPESQRAMIEGITVKQLMSHTAGLSVHGFPGYPTAGDPEIPSARQVLAGKHPANTTRVCLEGFPGQSFSYSGGGITVLQIILETVTGRDFPALMQDLVLGPLGMTRSFFNRLPEDEGNAATAYYTGYTPCEDGRRVNPEQAAAGLWTTPSDLLKVVQAVQKSLDGADDGLLRKETAEQMLTVVDAGVALSWFVPGEAKITFTHGGSNDPGFRCVFLGYADLLHDKKGVPRDCGMAIMTNSAQGLTTMWKISQAIAYLKRWPQVPSGGLSEPIITPFVLPEAQPGNAWKSWKGKWTDADGHHSYTVEADDAGKPVVVYDAFGPVRLLPGAMPSARHEDGEEFCVFVLEGLLVMLELKVQEGNKIIVLKNEANQSAKDLKRVDS